MCEAIEAGRRRMLRGWKYGQQGAPMAIGIKARTPADHAFAVLPHDFEAVLSLSTEQKGQVQLPRSVGKLIVCRLAGEPVCIKAPERRLRAA